MGDEETGAQCRQDQKKQRPSSNRNYLDFHTTSMILAQWFQNDRIGVARFQ